jgi:glycosyltransferase involved in cell wall biosynthesis
VDAFIELARDGSRPPVHLLLAGWLGKQNRAYADEQFAKLRAAGLGQAFQYLGEVDRAQKLDFLSRIDILSVPTVYQDPKGLYVLEALAAGVPVVLPAHGAFPELVASTGGGRLVTPQDPIQLAAHCRTLLADDVQRRQLGEAGRRGVLERHTAEAMALATLEVYRELLGA